MVHSGVLHLNTILAGQIPQAMQQFVGGMHRPFLSQRHPRLCLVAEIIDAHAAVATAKRLQDIGQVRDETIASLAGLDPHHQAPGEQFPRLIDVIDALCRDLVTTGIVVQPQPALDYQHLVLAQQGLVPVVNLRENTRRPAGPCGHPG